MDPTHQHDSHNGSASDKLTSLASNPLKGKYELILNWYKINGKKLSGEETLVKLQIQTLLSIFGNPMWNDIYHCWAIETKHIASLQTYTNHQFDSEKFTYFIEAYHIN